MKIEIVYIRSGDIDAPIAAKSEVMGELFVGMGTTPEAAKERLLARVNSFLNASLPPPETVEVPYGDEEMQTDWDKVMTDQAAVMDHMLEQISGTRDIEPRKV